MEFHAVHTLSLPLVLQDALIVVGASVALLASLTFINLGILLPGLLTPLAGPQPDQRGAYLEFGPASAPIISEPAPPREQMRRCPVLRRLQRDQSSGTTSGAVMALHLAPPREVVRQ